MLKLDRVDKLNDLAGYHVIGNQELNLVLCHLVAPGSKQAKDIFRILEEDIEYLKPEESMAKVFGKWHPVPRKVAGYGDPGVQYTYSRNTFKAKPWIPILEEIKNALNRILKVQYNFVLVNRYANGLDKMGEHKDNEKDLDQSVPISSVSFGASRAFHLRHDSHRKGDKTIPVVKITLTDGLLLLMNPPTNDHWFHSVPQRKSCHEPRINLTFRKIIKAR